MGLIGLLSLLFILILVRASLHLWVHPKTDPIAQQRIEKSWQDFKKEQAAKEATADTLINLNTADSIALTSIDHIGPVLAHHIIEKRKHLGSYKNYTQLLDIPRFPAKHLEEIKKQLIIK